MIFMELNALCSVGGRAFNVKAFDQVLKGLSGPKRLKRQRYRTGSLDVPGPAFLSGFGKCRKCRLELECGCGWVANGRGSWRDLRGEDESGRVFQPKLRALNFVLRAVRGRP